MKKIKRGFTLIELIVVVTVILVLAAIGVYTLNGYNKSREVDTLINEIGDYVKLARNLAITNQLPDGATDLSRIHVWVGDNNVAVYGITEVGVTKSFFNNKLKRGDDITLDVNGMNPFAFRSKTGRLINRFGLFVGNTVSVNVSSGDYDKQFSINDLGIVSYDK